MNRHRARVVRIAIGALALLVILIGVWAAFRQHADLSVSGSTSSLTYDEALDRRTAKPAMRSSSPKVLDLWTRPTAEVAARNYRKSEFAWILRQLGATELQLDRLADGDVAGLVTELKQKAQSGDADSINMLGEIALQNCRMDRDDETLAAYAASQIAEAQAFSAIDTAWFTAAMHEDTAFDRRVNAACKQVIDLNEILSWVTARAAQGDGASLWLLYRAAGNLTEMQQRLLEAAAAGFPQAQFELAWAIIAGQEGAAGTGAAKVHAGDLLRQSEDQLATSEQQLAFCEYSGCDGVTPDIDSAIKHAREAAQAGAIDAMLAIGPHLPAGQINPDEIVAWGLVHASLLQQGCGGNGFSVREMKGILSTLNANNISTQARSLAEQYWQDYGAQMMSNIGCSS
jgi:TPR repeat protein